MLVQNYGVEPFINGTFLDLCSYITVSGEMEVEHHTEVIEVIKPPSIESDQEKEFKDDEQFILGKSIEVENTSLKTVSTEATDLTQENSSENGKKKAKDEKPPSKIVVRRLPPTMTKALFLEQVSPLPDIDHMYYVQGNVNDNVNPFSRAYLNFVNQDDIFSFSETFDNYVFLDAKGQEYPAVVEFNMVQRFPKQRTKKKDPLVGTIESDPAWISFKENLLAEALENSKTQSGKATKQHYFETEISASATEEVNTTPLLEFLKVRRAEKARIREERREEKKRKELERKLKQKAKDKKGEVEEEESSKEVKIQSQHLKKSEKTEKEMTVDRNSKLVGEGKYNKDKEGKNEHSKSNASSQKKVLILKSDGNNLEKHIEKESSSISHKDETIVAPLTIKSGKGINQVEKVKEAEQQTMFLRKLLGLLPDDANKTSVENEVSAKSSDLLKNQTSNCDAPDCKSIQAPKPPKEILSTLKDRGNIFWSTDSINPALPSARFKTSSSTVESEAEASSIEQRSLSAPRDSRGGSSGRLGSQVTATSTPNVSLTQSADVLTILHCPMPLRNHSAEVSNATREEVLSSKDRRDPKEKERGTKKKDDRKEERPKEPRIREFKSRGGKSYQEERLKLAERREEKKREMVNSCDKKLERAESNDTIDQTLPQNENSKISDEKPIKLEKRRQDRYDRKSRYDDEWKEEKKRMRNEKNNLKREGKERKDEYRKNSDKRNSDLDLRRKGKSYKNSESAKYEKKKIHDQDDQDNKTKPSTLEKDKEEFPKRRSRSFDDLKSISTSFEGGGGGSDSIKAADTSTVNKKRCNSLENQKSDLPPESEVAKIILKKKEKNHSRDTKSSEYISSFRSRKDRSKNTDYKSSKSKEQSDNKNDKDKESSNNKNQEAAGDPETKKSETAPRSERRIRNKDRPSIEIYRPGMGKFSKQRLEKEKALGSSTEVDSPSHSPSPTPKSKLIT